MMIKTRKERREFSGLILLAALVLVPTAALGIVGLNSLARAQAAFERDIRDSYRSTAEGIVSQTTALLIPRLRRIQSAASSFLEDRTSGTRAALAEADPLVEGFVILDPHWRLVYPAPPLQAPAVLSPEILRLQGEAEIVEVQKGPAEALPLYQALLEKEGIYEQAASRYLVAIARCQAAIGETDKAVQSYRRLSLMQDYASDLSLPLLASFRIWQLAPSEESRLALLAACRAKVYTAPASQIRYCLKAAGGDTPEAATLSRAISTLLAARESDERLSRNAMFLVPPSAFSDEEGPADWTWRSQRLGDRWYVFACAPAGPSDDTGVHPVAVVFLETASLTSDLVAPLVNIRSKSEKASFSIAERGRWREAPPSGEETRPIVRERFDEPLGFLSIIVLDADNTLGDLARERVRLLTWAFVLAGIGVVAGMAAVFAWAARRARLARLQTDFVANVTHELKTPLTAIASLAETMQLGRVSTPEKNAEFLSAIVRETGRLSRLINNVLDFSRLERGVQQHHPESVDLADLVENVAASFKASLPESSDTAVDLELPDEPVFANVDPDWIARAIFNLLDNAYKYSREPRKIVISLEADGTAIIRVCDNGIGLSPADMKMIWRKFYRADSTLTAETQGAGLGLSLVSAYVEAHGGRVTAESDGGAGSTFSIFLPLDAGGQA